MVLYDDFAFPASRGRVARVATAAWWRARCRVR